MTDTPANTQTNEQDEFALEQALYEASLRTLDEGQVLTGVIVAKTHDELLVDIGGKSEGIVTGRELSPGMRIADLKVGDTLEVLVHRIDGDGDGAMYLSERRARALKTWERVLEAHQNNEAITATVTQVVKGGVLVDFGAFVDLGGVDGLIHNSELSWSRIKHPSEAVQIGDKVQVEIMKFDSEARKVSLSLKHSLEDPWKTVPDQLQEGQVVPATLIKATSNYLLVEVLPGVTGMVPKSEFDPNKTPQVGEQLNVKILSINAASRRINASAIKADGGDGDAGSAPEQSDTDSTSEATADATT